jgi:hypothetical protein
MMASNVDRDAVTTSQTYSSPPRVRQQINGTSIAIPSQSNTTSCQAGVRCETCAPSVVIFDCFVVVNRGRILFLDCVILNNAASKKLISSYRWDCTSFVQKRVFLIKSSAHQWVISRNFQSKNLVPPGCWTKINNV